MRESGFSSVHLEELIRELVGMLASYREEDAPLFPEVFVFDSLDGLTALSPSGNRIIVGTAPLEPASGLVILKNCAPLALEGWAIFAVKESDQIQYGLFRSVRHSLAMAAEESMRGLGNEAPIILIRNRGHLTVELTNTVDQRFTAALKTIPARQSRLEADVGSFVHAVSSKLKEATSFKTYFRRLLTGILQRCHGTLLAVIEYEAPSPVHPSLTDGVWLQPPVLLADLHARALATSTADALAELQGAEALLTGMMNSDGLVVFGTDGSILAYHVFLRPDDIEKALIPERGGGRRRTFELMKLRLATVFRAAFFRSQDGETICERSN